MKDKVNKDRLNASKECKQKAINSNKIVIKDENNDTKVQQKK